MTASSAARAEPASTGTDQKSSFTRGMFAGVVLDSLLFPYPVSLDQRNPEEARTVRRLIRDLRELQKDLIDPQRFDEEETIPEEVISAFARIGMLALTIPKKYGGHHRQRANRPARSATTKTVGLAPPDLSRRGRATAELPWPSCFLSS